MPFVLLNRTRHCVEVRDVSQRTNGRLLARAEAGCGTILYLDVSVSTRVKVTLFKYNGLPQSSQLEKS